MVADALLALIPAVYGLTRRLNARLHDEHQLSRQHVSLLFALKQTGPQAMHELARQAGMAKPNLTVLTKRLEELGLVERKHNVHDRRVIQLELTPSGDAYLEGNLATFHQLLGPDLERRSSAELFALHDSLVSIKAFLEDLNLED